MRTKIAVALGLALALSAVWTVAGWPLPLPGDPTPTLTPTSLVDSAALLYQAETPDGFVAWNLPNGWHLVDGDLVADGAGTEVLVPVGVSVADCALEVDLRLDDDRPGAYRFLLRGERVLVTLAVGMYPVIQAEIASPEGGGVAVGLYGDAQEGRITEGDWHTYRVEVRGTIATLLLDGQAVAQYQTDAFMSPTGGDVGLWSDGPKIRIRSLRIVTL